MDPRTRILLEAPVTRTILRLALPNVVVMMVQASIGLIETYFVAKLGLDALAGIALVFPLFMLLQMISAGAMGGGILSAIARALGAGERDRANELVWSAVAITIGLGALTTLAALLLGPKLYALMGGRDGSLAAATTYSAIVFAGAIPLWLFNSFAAIIRGTGNIFFPAAVIVAGALVLIPLSPLLIFGLGPFPHLGIAGGAAAVLLYYAAGCVVFASYIWSRRGVLNPPLFPPRLTWAPARDILRVGAVSSIVSMSTNLSIATATGLAGLIGPAAVAGYGTGARLEYLLVPLVFGLGAPMAAMVGTCIGAGRRDRALRVAWTGAAIAGGLSGAIGIAAALFPSAWLSLFGNDPEMIETGSLYLRIVGPTYGFFGGGLALYFASQGAGRVGWAMMVAVLRVMIATSGGWLAVTILGGSTALFVVIAGALVIYGLGNVAAVAGGTWFKTASSQNRQRRIETHVRPAAWSNDQAAPQRSFWIAVICGAVILTIGVGAREIFGIFHQQQELQMSDLKGTAIVTGATGGVGALYAAGLAERGYDLLLVGRQQKTLDALAKAVKQKANVKVETLVANLAEAKDLARVEARISSDPAITALINNAGSASFGSFVKQSSEAVDETTAVNITAMTRLTHAVLPGFLARGAGSIVNIASVLAFHPWPEFGVYNASKAYVVSFSQALQGEVAGKGVLVQVVIPPAVDTDFWNKAGLPVSNLPAGSVMKPQHLVNAALKGLDRGESWVFPSLPDQALWNDHEKTRQALVGGLMNGTPAARYAA